MEKEKGIGEMRKEKGEVEKEKGKCKGRKRMLKEEREKIICGKYRGVKGEGKREEKKKLGDRE